MQYSSSSLPKMALTELIRSRQESQTRSYSKHFSNGTPDTFPANESSTYPVPSTPKSMNSDNASSQSCKILKSLLEHPDVEIGTCKCKHEPGIPILNKVSRTNAMADVSDRHDGFNSGNCGGQLRYDSVRQHKEENETVYVRSLRKKDELGLILESLHPNNYKTKVGLSNFSEASEQNIIQVVSSSRGSSDYDYSRSFSMPSNREINKKAEDLMIYSKKLEEYSRTVKEKSMFSELPNMEAETECPIIMKERISISSDESGGPSIMDEPFTHWEGQEHLQEPRKEKNSLKILQSLSSQAENILNEVQNSYLSPLETMSKELLTMAKACAEKQLNNSKLAAKTSVYNVIMTSFDAVKGLAMPACISKSHRENILKHIELFGISPAVNINKIVANALDSTSKYLEHWLPTYMRKLEENHIIETDIWLSKRRTKIKRCLLNSREYFEHFSLSLESDDHICQRQFFEVKIAQTLEDMEGIIEGGLERVIGCLRKIVSTFLHGPVESSKRLNCILKSFLTEHEAFVIYSLYDYKQKFKKVIENHEGVPYHLSGTSTAQSTVCSEFKKSDSSNEEKPGSNVMVETYKFSNMDITKHQSKLNIRKISIDNKESYFEENGCTTVTLFSKQEFVEYCKKIVSKINTNSVSSEDVNGCDIKRPQIISHKCDNSYFSNALSARKSEYSIFNKSEPLVTENSGVSGELDETKEVRIESSDKLFSPTKTIDEKIISHKCDNSYFSNVLSARNSKYSVVNKSESLATENSGVSGELDETKEVRIESSDNELLSPTKTIDENRFYSDTIDAQHECTTHKVKPASFFPNSVEDEIETLMKNYMAILSRISELMCIKISKLIESCIPKMDRLLQLSLSQMQAEISKNLQKTELALALLFEVTEKSLTSPIP